MWVSPKGGEGDSGVPPRIVSPIPLNYPWKPIIRPKEAYYRTPPEDTTGVRNEVSQVLEDNFGLTIESINTRSQRLVMWKSTTSMSPYRHR
jgi:glutamine synthetase